MHHFSDDLFQLAQEDALGHLNLLGQVLDVSIDAVPELVELFNVTPYPLLDLLGHLDQNSQDLGLHRVLFRLVDETIVAYVDVVDTIEY